MIEISIKRTYRHKKIVYESAIAATILDFVPRRPMVNTKSITVFKDVRIYNLYFHKGHYEIRFLFYL